MAKDFIHSFQQTTLYITKNPIINNAEQYNIFQYIDIEKLDPTLNQKETDCILY